MSDKAKLLKEIADKGAEIAECRAKMFSLDKYRDRRAWLDCKAKLATLRAEHQRIAGLISVEREKEKERTRIRMDATEHEQKTAHRVPNAVLKRLLNAWRELAEDETSAAAKACRAACIADLEYVMSHHELPDA